MEPRTCRATGADPCVSAQENASSELIDVGVMALLDIVYPGDRTRRNFEHHSQA